MKPTMTNRQIDAVAYELAEQFYKRIGWSKSLHDLDELAAMFAEKIHEFLKEDDEPG